MMIVETMSAEQYRRMMNLDGDVGDDEKTARNALRGRKAQVVGESFQKRLNAYHAELMQEDTFLYLLETKPPMRAISQGRGKRPLYALTGSGPCDYVFAMTCGIAGTFDAKSTDSVSSFTWPARRTHQLDTLRLIQNLSEGSAPAFALVEWRRHDEVRLHPIAGIKDRTVRRHDGIVVPMLPANHYAWTSGPAWHQVVYERWYPRR